MEIEEKGELKKYELMPKRKLYIAVYKLGGGEYYSSSNENKQELICYMDTFSGCSDVRIYTVDLE